MHHKDFCEYYFELEMWANAQPDGRPVEYNVQHRKVWLTPAAGVPCSNGVNIRERETWT